jgi:cellulase/cellobiase CelA1
VANEWSNGFQGEVTIRNGATAITGWTVTWTFANGQTVSQLWNGSHTQTGANVTVRNAAWNGALPPGGTTTVGFTGTRTGTNAVPASVSCARA